MFETMRQKLGPIVVAIIVGLIAFVFVFYGVYNPKATRGLTTGASAAKVNGDDISMREFYQLYQQQTEMYKNMMGDISANPMMEARLRTMVLDQLVQRKIVLQQAQKLGIIVSDEEIKNEIVNLPYFKNKETGAFDPKLYNQLLTMNQKNPTEFEETIRKDLMTKKVYDFIGGNVKVSDEEVKDYFKIENNKRKIRYVSISKEIAAKNVTVSDDEINKYLADAANLSKVKNIHASKTEYNTPEKVCYKQLFVGAKNAAKNIEDIHSKLTVSNFEAKVIEFSDDPLAKTKKGDMGCTSIDSIEPDMVKELSVMKKGDISKPITIADRKYVLLKYDSKPAVVVPFETVKNIIAKEVIASSKEKEIEKLTADVAEKIKIAMNSNDSGLKDILKQYGLEDKESPEFSQMSASIPGLGQMEDLIKDSFAESKPIFNKANIYKKADSTVVALVKAESLPNMTDFEAQKSKLITDLKSQKTNLAVDRWMKSIQKEAKVEKNQDLIAVRKDD